MKGMNAKTGRTLEGIDHLHQSVGKIVSTPLASCIKRRTFGSEVPDLIDAPGNGAVLTRLYAATAAALMRWEPRLTLTRVALSSESAALGQMALDIEGHTTESGEDLSTTVKVMTESSQ